MVIDLGNGVFMKDVEGTKRQRRKFARSLLAAFVFLLMVRVCGAKIPWFVVLAPIAIPIFLLSLICLFLGFLIVRERIW